MWVFIDMCTLPRAQASQPPRRGWGERMLLGRRAGISCPFMRQALLNTYCVPGADCAGSPGLVGKTDTNKIKANRELDIAHGAVMA